MLCMVDANGGRGYPRKPGNVGAVRRRMRAVDVGAEELVEGIGRGFAWMPSFMERGMTRACWRSQQLVGLDFDNKEGCRILTLDAAVGRLAANGIIPMCVYHTYSSTEETPRFRVVLMLEEPCEDPDVMEMAISNLLELFPEADQQCRDLSRLFFGASRAECVYETYRNAGWAPCDIRVLLELKRVNAKARRDGGAEKPSGGLYHAGVHGRENRASWDDDVDDLKERVDLAGIIAADTGEAGRRSGRSIKFHLCPVCGHHDCFAFYPETNSWACFSSSNMTGRRGGSVIDYIMATRSLSCGEAIKILREEAGREGPAS